MRRVILSLVLAASTLYPLLPVYASDGDLSKGVDLADFADLEALARRVERDGLRELHLKTFSPGLPKGLRFRPPGGAAFRTQWLKSYETLCRGMFAKLRGIADTEALKEGEKIRKAFRRLLKGLKKVRKKNQAAKEGLEVLEAALPRVNELIEKVLGRPSPPDLIPRRQAFLKRFSKRFELGKTQSLVTLSGSTGVDVKVTQEKWQFVVGEVGAWRFKPLQDEGKAALRLGGMSIEFARKLRTGKLRQSLRDLTYLEYFSLRFSQVQRISGGVAGHAGETIHIVGARLLFGFFYFIRYDQKLVVVREPKPVGEPKR
jgi:hypothetical protein